MGVALSTVSKAWRAPPIALLEQWGGIESRPRIILGEDGALLWSNPSADEMMLAGVDLIEENAHFRLVNPAEQAEFEAFLAAATPEVSAWCTPQVDGDYLLFRAWRIITDGVEAIGLVFHPAGVKYVPTWANFTRVFGLTATEYRVALLLLDGLKVEEAAERMSITVGTVRIHVRNLYAKLEVSSREQMFRLLAPFRVA